MKRLALLALFVASAGCAAQSAAVPPTAAPSGAAAPVVVAAPPAAAPPPPPEAPAKQPVSSAEQEPATGVGADLDALAQAEAQIASLSPAPADKKAERSEAGRATAMKEATPCAMACAALLSMTNATAHLCALTSDADAQCTDARARTAKARERVKQACPSCS